MTPPARLENAAGYRVIGTPIKRKEDFRLLTGRGKYAADIRLPGLLYAAVLRSPHPHARIAAILRNAGDAEVAASAPPVIAPEERDLIKRLADFPGVAEEAAFRRGPQAIPNYAIRVADDFHRFYHHHRVLESEQQGFRLGLCRATQAVIARCLGLIGVEAPDRM